MQPMNNTPRRDPAPTRFSYKLQRLWLTPSFRSFLRLGLPMCFGVVLCGWYFSSEERREGIAEAYAEARRTIEERPEFMVKLMTVEQASVDVADDIREILPLDFPMSSFDLDLEQMRATVIGLDAVERADLRIKPGGILEVSVVEREPAVIWRGRMGLEVLDQDGHRVGPLEARASRPDLPLIAGDGADVAAGEALDLLAAMGPLTPRLRGLVRIGERRWDVVLDRGQRIMLPEEDPVPSLQRVIALSQAEDMLSRDLVVIDMRNTGRPTLRMTNNATEELRRIKSIEAGVVSQ